MAKDVAAKPDITRKPRDWDQAVLAAFFTLIGMPRPKAAKAAGVGERTRLLDGDVKRLAGVEAHGVTR